MQLLENIFGKKNNIKVLRHLAMHKDWQFNITELARDISVNKGILSKLVESLEKETILNEKKIAEVFESAELNKDIPAQIPELKEEIEKLKELIQEETRNWTSQKQEVKTLIKQKENELNKVAAQYSLIEQKGEDGACPTCERPLKGEFEKVIASFNETLQTISREIQALIEQDGLLSAEPEIIKTGIETLKIKEKEYETLNKIQGQFEEKIKLYENIKAEVVKKKEAKAKMEETLKGIPQEFDAKLLEKLRQDFIALKKIYDEILGLKAQLINKDKIKQTLELATKNKQEADNKKKELEAYKAAAELIGKEHGAKVEIVAENASKEAKAKQAMPGKPAIVVE